MTSPSLMRTLVRKMFATLKLYEQETLLRYLFFGSNDSTNLTQLPGFAYQRWPSRYILVPWWLLFSTLIWMAGSSLSWDRTNSSFPNCNVLCCLSKVKPHCPIIKSIPLTKSSSISTAKTLGYNQKFLGCNFTSTSPFNTAVFPVTVHSSMF